jgi:hypothetical protein
MASFTQSQLLSSFDISRIVGNDQSGLILSCSDSIYSNHQITRLQYYQSRIRGCPQCQHPISEQEKKILKLKLHGTTSLPIPANRQFSVRAPPNGQEPSDQETEGESDLVVESESTIECAVCKESPYRTAKRPLNWQD